MANIIALACSAAFPTSGSNMTLINVTGIFHAVDAPCKAVYQTERFIASKSELIRTLLKFYSKPISDILDKSFFSFFVKYRKDMTFFISNAKLQILNGLI